MPLAREQRIRLARVLSWSRSHGWVHDAYPNTWRSRDGQTHVRYDTAEHTLVVDHMKPHQDPLRCRVAMVPVDSPEIALDVLSALGHLPWGYRRTPREVNDDETRAAYRELMPPAGHRYMSTYCQHGRHNNCRQVCKCCDAPCVCSDCVHTPTETPAGPDDAGTFDGPADFAAAGRSFAYHTFGCLTSEQCAEVLSKLAREGLIISVAAHEDACGQLAGAEGELFADLAVALDGGR